MTDWAEVAERIVDDDVGGVVSAFNELTEAQRRALAPEALKHYRRNDLNTVAGLAVLATGTQADVEKLWPGVVARQADACVEILAERRPKWLKSWMNTLCERETAFAWPVARGLRLRGLYADDTRSYALAFIAGIGGQGRKPIYDLLLADPTLLDDELWRAFQIEGGGDTSFAAHDKYTSPESSWSAALRRLADEGHIDRQRLIDATLDALSRGYSAFRAGWFVRFHDELDVTLEERRARADRYLDLLGSPTAQVQSFAVKAIAALDKAEPLEEPRLIGSLRPAVLNRSKGTASQALRLVDAAADRAPGSHELAALVAAGALLHEGPDLQTRALAIVERYAGAAGEDLAAALASAAPVIAPSLRSRLAMLAGDASIAEGRLDPDTSARHVEPEVASSRWPDSMLDVPVVDALDPIAPIETPAELALVVARVLEHPEEIDDLERAIDGISRLCDASRLEPAAMWAPIRKRAERRLREHDPFDRRGVVATDFAALVAAWLDRKQPPPIDPPLTVMGFFSTRLHAVAQRAALGGERPLLSAPTHAGGWIDPEILVARLATGGEPGDEADRVLALLRLAPDRRERALAAAAELPGEPAAALRFALGSDREEPLFASPTWVAAVRARFPGRDASDLGPAFRTLGTGAARIARPTIAVKQEGKEVVWHHLYVTPDVEGRPPSALYPTVAMHASAQHRPWAGSWYWWGANGCGTGAESEAEVRWCATLQPIDLDPYLTEGLARIGNNLDWWEARWEQRAFLEALLDVRTNFSGVAVRLLTLALAAKEPGIRGLAADTTAHALTDGRLASSTLGASLGEAWASPLVTPRRFALSLVTAAAMSAESRGCVRDALTLGLRTPPHTDAAPILELLHELCHADEVGVDDHEARSSLASYTSGKAGRLAKSLLAI